MISLWRDCQGRDCNTTYFAKIACFVILGLLLPLAAGPVLRQGKVGRVVILACLCFPLLVA
jgi:hypothetical protein